MKKIKYIGIATATLLAVSPVVTNAVSQPQTVQADGFSDFVNVIKSAFKTAASDLKDKAAQAGKTEAAKTTAEQDAATAISDLKDVVYDEDNPLNKASLQVLLDNNNKKISAYQLSQILTQTGAIKGDTAGSETLKKIASANLDVTISGAKDDNNFQKLIANMANNGNGESFQILITAKDPAAKDATTNVANHFLTFTNNTKETVQASSLNVKFTNPLNVDLNSKTVDPTLTDSVTDTKVTDTNNTNVTYTSNPGNLYNNTSDARARGNNYAKLGADFNVDGAVYYQPVQLKFDDKAVNVSAMLEQMHHDGSTQITLNGTAASDVDIDASTNSVYFVREIKVGSSDVDPDDNNNGDTDTDTDTNTDNGTWDTTSQAGIVTVGGSNAALSNDDNAVTSRMVAANSAWQTDQYRVNSKTGVKQYRVSTHEWVNASDVTFAVKDTSAGLHNVTDLSGNHTVSLDGPEGFVYALFSVNGDRSNRGLAGLSAWFTDKSATDAQGNTYYRVSTDEWVMASTGVHFN
ncbi:hypothetical protein [Companilactobacillus ginsenosidimutans]|uniref:Surface layer protein A domain-containing protein n=1 Tax=Companilactobacillus ginsenosidimutans TaxID=1007676 RepID=A0A0H4R0J2_9LACO|nr:hypothetical protein [Companilactobacillus ginsenosidimutans]AKP67245.1 hypothetical protein ABM34_06630 [Companilactobacillus ginsenosidimutans]